MVRVSDASPLIDLSGVLTYGNQNKKKEHVVHLHNAERRPSFVVDDNVKKCNHCGQWLKKKEKVQESFHYCSIGCKVSATGKEKEAGGQVSGQERALSFGALQIRAYLTGADGDEDALVRELKVRPASCPAPLPPPLLAPAGAPG